MLADRLPAMCGKETLTTVVSSTSIKVLDITAIATSQGLTSAGLPGWEEDGFISGSVAMMTNRCE